MKKHLALLLALTMTGGAALTGCGGSLAGRAAMPVRQRSCEVALADSP